MAFDGAMAGREDRRVATQKKPVASKRTVARKSATRGRAPNAAKRRATGQEPEELGLWRQIIGYRDVLEKSATGWTDFLAAQRRGHARRPLAEIPAPARETSRAVREHSDALVEGIATTARDRLHAFDAEIEGLRATKGKTYPLSKLLRVAESFQAALLKDAIDRVAEWHRNQSEHAKLLAQAAITCARDTTPRAVDVQPEMHGILDAREEPDLGDLVAAAIWPEKVEVPIDLDRLLADARADRTAKNESSTTVARRIVASALGRKPHERKMRR